MPLQQGRSFPLNPHSRPFTPANVVPSEGDSEGEVAPEDVLHSSCKEDEMCSLPKDPASLLPDLDSSSDSVILEECSKPR